MQNLRVDKLSQRWAVSGAIVIISLVGWWVLLFATFSYPIGQQEYGFPLTYHRVYRSTIDLSFPVPFYFDLVIAAVVVSASGYSFWMWSGGWSPRRMLAVIATVVLWLTLYVCLNRQWIPVPFILLFLPALLVIPIAWLVSLVYTSRNIGSFLFGKSRAPLLPLILVFVFFVGAGSCDSFDIYENDGDRTKIPALVENLSHGDRDVRSLSLSVLRKLSPYDEATASAILQAMQDPDDQVQSNAISLASQLGPFAVRAVPILIEKFTKNGSCTFELAELGPVAKDAIPALEEQLPSTKGYNKLGIARALWSINRNSKLIVPVLIELLQDDFGPIRVDAATLLGEIGPDAKDAAPVLQKMIDYQPKADLNPPNETTDKPSGPVIRQMSEAEFYPQIRSAAETALQKILGTK